jgi:hypothetical protein
VKAGIGLSPVFQAPNLLLNGGDVMDEFSSSLAALGFCAALLQIVFFPFTLIFELLGSLFLHPTV